MRLFSLLSGKAKQAFEWLCNKVEPTLTTEQRYDLARCYESINKSFGIDILPHDMAELSPEMQRNMIEHLMDLYPNVVMSEYVTHTLATSIPFRAKPAIYFWKALTYGTDCHCCWSYRVMLFGVICFIAGLWLG